MWGREDVKNIQKNKQNLLLFGGGNSKLRGRRGREFPPLKALKKTLHVQSLVARVSPQLCSVLARPFPEGTVLFEVLMWVSPKTKNVVHTKYLATTWLVYQGTPSLTFQTFLEGERGSSLIDYHLAYLNCE